MSHHVVIETAGEDVVSELFSLYCDRVRDDRAGLGRPVELEPAIRGQEVISEELPVRAARKHANCRRAKIEHSWSASHASSCRQVASDCEVCPRAVVVPVELLELVGGVNGEDIESCRCGGDGKTCRNALHAAGAF